MEARFTVGYCIAATVIQVLLVAAAVVPSSVGVGAAITCLIFLSMKSLLRVTSWTHAVGLATTASLAYTLTAIAVPDDDWRSVGKLALVAGLVFAAGYAVHRRRVLRS